ncbi:uncharacterized protein KY384_000035 [Bacidia gigantensis]|uniref:uncharacterized protein n=1 Tax=Bacidia gigantensis TaxID=2732470 RepID=UPI001D036719|nr:uncharacterized protein KY384_000035 [Bacidia gigantensis]KAG8526442.1 hypothetical protein KY384_000035 [Bacidia gigantensis]
MPWKDFSAVLKSKVMGSKNLDGIFHDEPLDCFICFSSTTSIVVSIGLSAYAAANQYITSIIEQRRQRGLPSSVIHIAFFTGFGYIFRRDAEHTETIHKAILPRFERQSETGLYEMLAKAITCGRPGSGETAKLITGIRTVFQGEWRDDPRLSGYSGQQQLQNDSNQEQDAKVCDDVTLLCRSFVDSWIEDGFCDVVKEKGL